MGEATKKGIDSLKESVMKDCAGGNNCFNPNGCDKERYLYLPETDPTMIKYGGTKCVANTKCTHDYCGKFKWVLERAAIYAKFSGKTVEEILEVWEKDRSYWYMNYYQDSNQPNLEELPSTLGMIPFEKWVEELESLYGKDRNDWAFICPICKNVQTGKDLLAAGCSEENLYPYMNCVGRYTKEKGCDWTLGGLFQVHKRIVVKDGMAFPVFETAPKI